MSPPLPGGLWVDGRTQRYNMTAVKFRQRSTLKIKGDRQTDRQAADLCGMTDGAQRARKLVRLQVTMRPQSESW